MVKTSDFGSENGGSNPPGTTKNTLLTIMQPYATIQLNIYKSGIMVSCEDTGDEIFINKNDGNLQPLVDFINKVDEECNPETTYTLTEKGKETLAAINSGADVEDLTEQ